jgi:hypothetical protein
MESGKWKLVFEIQEHPRRVCQTILDFPFSIFQFLFSSFQFLLYVFPPRYLFHLIAWDMERRTFIIGVVAGGIGLLEYGFVSRYMNSLHAPPRAWVKAYEPWAFGNGASCPAPLPTHCSSKMSAGNGIDLPP